MSVPEVLTNSGWKRIGPPLPKSLYLPCLMVINVTSILIMAGSINGEETYSKKTFIFNSETNLWTSGPELIQPTRSVGCGTIPNKLNGTEKVFIVAGGENVGRLVQLLDSADDGEWYQGDLKWFPSQATSSSF